MFETLVGLGSGMPQTKQRHRHDAALLKLLRRRPSAYINLVDGILARCLGPAGTANNLEVTDVALLLVTILVFAGAVLVPRPHGILIEAQAGHEAAMNERRSGISGDDRPTQLEHNPVVLIPFFLSKVQHGKEGTQGTLNVQRVPAADGRVGRSRGFVEEVG